MSRNGSSITSSPQHGRRDLAQFWTPPEVADFMAEWVLGKRPEFVVDPAFGMAALADAVKRRSPSTPVLGFEVDSDLITRYREAGGDAVVHEADYTSVWSRGSYPAIVCNPPYLRSHRFRERREALSLYEEKTGTRLPGNLSSASFFLLKSLGELSPTGRLAYLLPHEFMGTGYGVDVKRALLRHGLHTVIIIEDEQEVFANAMTSVCVLLCDQTHSGEVTFRLIGSPEDLRKGSYLREVRVLPKTEDNWLNYLDESPGQQDGLVPMRTYGLFRRGIATGANGFFTMKPSEARARGLATYVQPCITRACQVSEAVITKDSVQRLVESDDRVYLLMAPPEQECDNLRAYLQRGEDEGVHTGALAMRRKPWYHIEAGGAPHLLVSTFGRGSFKVVRNDANLVTLNAWHGFHPDARRQSLVDALFIWMKSPQGQHAMLHQRRRYGRKLDKLEPGDLNRMMVPPPEVLTSLNADHVMAELDRLRRGRDLSAKFLKRLERLSG